VSTFPNLRSSRFSRPPLAVACLGLAVAFLGTLAGCGEGERNERPPLRTGPGVELLSWHSEVPPGHIGCRVRAKRHVRVVLDVRGAATRSPRPVTHELKPGEIAHVHWSRGTGAIENGGTWVERIAFGFDQAAQGWGMTRLAQTDEKPVERAYDHPASPLPEPVEREFELAVRTVGQGDGTPQTLRPRPSGARILPPLPSTLPGTPAPRRDAPDPLRSVLRLFLVVEPLD